MVTSVDFFYLAHYFGMFIYASGNLYFNEVTFARFQPPSQSQNKYLISYLEINRDRRLVV